MSWCLTVSFYSGNRLVCVLWVYKCGGDPIATVKDPEDCGQKSVRNTLDLHLHRITYPVGSYVWRNPMLLITPSLQWSMVVVVSCQVYRWPLGWCEYSITTFTSNFNPDFNIMSCFVQVHDIKSQSISFPGCNKNVHFWLVSGFWSITHTRFGLCGWKTSGIKSSFSNKSNMHGVHIFDVKFESCS